MSSTAIWTSWNQRLSHPYHTRFVPADEASLQQAISTSESVRIIGTGRSSADICAGTVNLISLEQYNQVLEIDPVKRTVRAQSGILLSTLIERLAAEGFGLPALPDIDCITLGGAIATGTHGTGRTALSLSDYMVACEAISPEGTLLRSGDGQDEIPLDALRVSLGVLGVLSTITLSITPLFNLALEEKPCRDATWLENWPEWLESNDFLRVLWLPHTDYGMVIKGSQYDGIPPFAAKSAPGWHKYRRDLSAKLYRHTVRHPGFTTLSNRLLKALFFSSTVRRLGNLYDTSVTKSRGSTLELAEWTIPFSRFSACFGEIRRELNRGNAHAHIPMDVRFIRASSAWLANSYGEDSVTIGCVSRTPAHADSYAAFGLMERVFLAHGGRPHWAKRFAAGADALAPLYPRWNDFCALRQRLDPRGKFLNKRLAALFAE